MSCCGTKRGKAGRFEGSAQRRGYRLANAAVAAQTDGQGQEIRIRYRGRDTIALRGPMSGRSYRFDAGEVATVHPLDCAALLRSGHFALA